MVRVQIDQREKTLSSYDDVVRSRPTSAGSNASLGDDLILSKAEKPRATFA